MLISVIVITRNRPEMIKKCMEHLYRQTYKELEIIVVDSSTTLETQHLIEQKFPDVQYMHLKNGKHKMPVARNLGIRYTNGEIVCFLDDDSMAPPNWVEEIVKSFSDTSIGAVGGLVLEPNGPKEEPARDRSIGHILANGERITNYHLNPGRTLEVDLVRGCNMSFRRNVMQQIGGFDPAFTGTNVFEAGDYCARVRNAGYKVLFNPDARVVHLSAAREDIPRELTDFRTQFYNARNWTLWVGKNIGWNSKNLFHLWFKEPIQAFCKHGRTKKQRLAILSVNLIGKISGTFAWCKWRYLNHREPPVLN